MVEMKEQGMDRKEQEAKAFPKGLAARWKALPSRTRKKRIRLLCLVLILALAGGLVIDLVQKQREKQEDVLTNFVEYGAITSKIENSGLTKAYRSESLGVTTAGTLTEVFVTEGQKVAEGDRLYTVDSPAALAAVEKGRNTVRGIQKQISAMEKDLAGLNLTPTYSGKLLEVEKLNPGDSISKGQKVAVLADDSRMRLEQYYSYAYAGEIRKGQSVQVSIPSLMSTVTGTVEAVHMVSRITPEGSQLFSADIVVKNPGSMTAGMAATATATVKGETIYPYEQGTLAYYQSGELCAGVSGTVVSSALLNYLPVSPGQVLVKISGEENEGELFDLHQQLETAQEELEKAEKNLANCAAVAPFGGTVIGLTLSPGDEIDTQSPILMISDTSKLLIHAEIDERNLSQVHKGCMVDLNQNDTYASGVVESVSLSSKVSNGVARYPIVIAAENPDGALQVNSYIQYSVVAGENDNCLILPVQCVRSISKENGDAATVVYVAGEKPDHALETAVMEEEIPQGFWPVEVEIGLQDGINVEIKSGVEEGTEVFTQLQTTEMWGSQP